MENNTKDEAHIIDFDDRLRGNSVETDPLEADALLSNLLNYLTVL